jgi:hypothetical protein
VFFQKAAGEMALNCTSFRKIFLVWHSIAQFFRKSRVIGTQLHNIFLDRRLIGRHCATLGFDAPHIFANHPKSCVSVAYWVPDFVLAFRFDGVFEAGPSPL